MGRSRRQRRQREAARRGVVGGKGDGQSGHQRGPSLGAEREDIKELEDSLSELDAARSEKACRAGLRVCRCARAECEVGDTGPLVRRRSRDCCGRGGPTDRRCSFTRMRLVAGLIPDPAGKLPTRKRPRHRERSRYESTGAWQGRVAGGESDARESKVPVRQERGTHFLADVGLSVATRPDIAADEVTSSLTVREVVLVESIRRGAAVVLPPQRFRRRRPAEQPTSRGSYASPRSARPLPKPVAA